MYKIVLIGAGSTQFGLGTVGDIFKSKILEGSTITPVSYTHLTLPTKA